MKKAKRKENKKNLAIIISICVVLSVYALTIISILAWGFLTSLKNDVDYTLLKNKFGLPNLKYSKEEFLSLKNYRLIFSAFEFKRVTRFYSGEKLIVHRATLNIGLLLMNTFIFAGLGAVLRALVPCVMGYLCAKYPFKLSKIIYATCLIVMIIPIVGSSASELALLRRLNLYDSFLGYIIQSLNFTGMYFFIFYAYYQGVPDSYTEAAEMDGASQLTIFIKIMLPLTVKMMSTVALLQFVALWNNYQYPLMYLPTHPTLSYGVFYMVYLNPSGPLSKLPIKVAGCMMLALPILVLFIFLKDKLMGNVSLGGLKE